MYYTLTIILYDSEIWTITKKKSNRKQTEMKFFRTTAGYLLDLKRNEELLEELGEGQESVENKIQEHKSNGLIMYQEWKTSEFQNLSCPTNQKDVEDQKDLS